MLTLKEFSWKLGLSPTTISRALNGYPEVSERTRSLVEAAAKRYNYQPNSRAQSLATGRSKTIGYVLSVSENQDVTNPIFGDFIAGASSSYAKAGYNTLISLAAYNEEEKLFRELYSKRSVDGVILQAPKVSDNRIELLNQLGIPFVVHGRASNSDNYSWVDVDNQNAFYRATKFLLDLGHSRISLINGDEARDFAYRRKQGFSNALREHGHKIQPNYLFQNIDMTESYGHRATQELLRLEVPPSAILVSSLVSAIGVRRAIHDVGLHLGEDISVITHDDDLSYLKNSQKVPVFTATRSSVREAGRLCAESLLDIIDNPSQAQRHEHKLEAELVVGQSTGNYQGTQ